MMNHVMITAMPNVLIRSIIDDACYAYAKPNVFARPWNYACYAYGHAECFNKANKRKRMFCLWPRRMF